MTLIALSSLVQVFFYLHCTEEFFRFAIHYADKVKPRFYIRVHSRIRASVSKALHSFCSQLPITNWPSNGLQRGSSNPTDADRFSPLYYWRRNEFWVLRLPHFSRHQRAQWTWYVSLSPSSQLDKDASHGLEIDVLSCPSWMATFLSTVYAENITDKCKFETWMKHNNDAIRQNLIN